MKRIRTQPYSSVFRTYHVRIRTYQCSYPYVLRTYHVRIRPYSYVFFRPLSRTYSYVFVSIIHVYSYVFRTYFSNCHHGVHCTKTGRRRPPAAPAPSGFIFRRAQIEQPPRTFLRSCPGLFFFPFSTRVVQEPFLPSSSELRQCILVDR